MPDPWAERMVASMEYDLVLKLVELMASMMDGK